MKITIPNNPTPTKLCQFVLVFLLMLFTGFSTMAQQALTGRVKDKNGAPVPSVTVKLSSSTNATQTAADGTFTLTVETIKATDVLEFSSVGFDNQTVAVDGRTNFEIVLVNTTALLDDVVVVGYGTQTKKNLTGAVNTIAAKNIENKPVTVGSSRVDLQACKLEYSIVSPK